MAAPATRSRPACPAPPADGVASDLGWALGTVMRAYGKAAGGVMDGLPSGPRGYQLLATANALGAPPRQQALAAHLGVDRTVMTYLVDDLEAAGLVERRPDPVDRRARLIAVTDAGVARLCEVRQALDSAERHVLAPLAEPDRARLRGLLAHLAGELAAGEPGAGVCGTASPTC